MASKTRSFLKDSNSDFDNILDSMLNLADADAQTVTSAVTVSGATTLSSTLGVTGAATFTASPVFNGRIIEAITLENVDAQNLTVTAARFLKGLIVHTSVTGGGTATMDTGPNLISGLGLTAVGQAMKCTYVNDGNQTVTFAVASGTTLTNVDNVVLTNSSCTLICRMTAAATVDVTIANN